MTTTMPDGDATREAVRDAYGKIAEEGGRCGCGTTCCGGDDPDMIAKAVGYSAEDLEALPEGANMGLSCGNPTAIASLKAGETALDLGSGGGFDVFIAGRQVEETGRVIGVDMTPDMLMKARRNIDAYKEASGLDNVEFRLGEIEHIPVADASVDVVMSNCVINLSPNKPQVWKEIARVLKPGGRVAISDLVLLQPLPEAVKAMVEALVGCIAGASLVDEVVALATAAGLKDVRVEPKTGNVDAMADWNDPLYRKIAEHLPEGARPSDYVASAEIGARNG